MKKLLAILVLGLFLITPSQADDSRDFQIEGMSVGDSLLDYFTEEKIEASHSYSYPKDKSFIAIDIRDPSFKVYDHIQVHVKKNDKKYVMYALAGKITYPDNINDCYKKKDEIVKELSNFLLVKKDDQGTSKHPGDKTGKSKTTTVVFHFSSGDAIIVECYDWSTEMNRSDGLLVAIDKKEFGVWLRTKAF